METVAAANEIYATQRSFSSVLVQHVYRECVSGNLGKVVAAAHEFRGLLISRYKSLGNSNFESWTANFSSHVHFVCVSMTRKSRGTVNRTEQKRLPKDPLTIGMNNHGLYFGMYFSLTSRK
jgi:hypothetical protein